MSGSDPQSPTAMVMAYLSSKGLPPTSQNVSRALQMNAENPGMIPGLTNQAPPPPDAMPSRGGPGAGRPAPQQQAQRPPNSTQSQGGLPVPPIPPAQVPPVSSGALNGGGGATAQQPPQQEDSWLNNLMSMLGIGVGGAAGMLNQGQQGSHPGFGPQATRGPIDVPPNMISGAESHLGLPGADQLQLEGPQRQLGAPPSPATPQQGQMGGPPQGQQQLPSPGEKPAIPMPNQSSGPTINMPDHSTPGMGEAIDFSKLAKPGGVPSSPPTPVPADYHGMPEGMDWGKILGEVAPLLKRMRP